MGWIIAFVSGKGGTGKTTAVAAIGSCLAAIGHRTLVVDCDIGLRNLDIAVGMTEFAIDNFSDVLDGRQTLIEAAKEHPDIPGLYFLAAPADRGIEEINPDAFDDMLVRAKEDFDFILTDSPAGLGAGFRHAVRCADIAVIVVMPDASSIRDASVTAEELRSSGIEIIRMLINRTVRKSAYIDEVIDDVGVRLLGAIKYDLKVPMALDRSVALVLNSTSGAARDFLDAAISLKQITEGSL